jgi:hypothetical protein
MANTWNTMKYKPRMDLMWRCVCVGVWVCVWACGCMGVCVGVYGVCMYVCVWVL